MSTEVTQSNNKRIAKNTLLLYFRMLFLMLISLYTSRINLNALGFEDFGIYNVVGGVITSLSLITAAISSAVSRFLTIEIGKGCAKRISEVFSTSMNVLVAFAIIAIIIAETVGLWFINTKLVIPQERIVAANWVFQFSLFSFVLGIISIPYNSLIIAHERMKAFAYISIIEVLGKLAIAFFITITPFDKLIFFSFLICLVAFIVRMIYNIYCHRNFPESKYRFIYDKSLLKQMFGFAGWNFVGAGSMIVRDQGSTILINIFFGPIVNAARAISIQVNTAVTGFVNNFQMALNPQITKNYAVGNFDYVFKLVFQGARLSYYILMLLSLPILLNTGFILHIWLENIPEHTIHFVRLVLIFAMSESLGNSLVTVMLAYGKIRNYQLIVGGLQCMNIPVSYLLLKLGCIPEVILLVAIFFSIVCEAARLIMLKGMIGLPIKLFLYNVYFNVIIVTLMALIIPATICLYMDEGWATFILSSLIAEICSVVSILFVGCKKEERHLVYSYIAKTLHRFRK